MNTTINFFFYDQHRKLSIGDTVTVAQVKYGETRGERAKLEKITARYIEKHPEYLAFVKKTGSYEWRDR